MKICYDPCYIDIRVAMATKWRRFLIAFVFLGTSSFFFFFCRNRLKEFLLPLVASIMAKFEQNLWERFRSILKKRFKGHKNKE